MHFETALNPQPPPARRPRTTDTRTSQPSQSCCSAAWLRCSTRFRRPSVRALPSVAHPATRACRRSPRLHEVRRHPEAGEVAVRGLRAHLADPRDHLILVHLRPALLVDVRRPASRRSPAIANADSRQSVRHPLTLKPTRAFETREPAEREVQLLPLGMAVLLRLSVRRVPRHLRHLTTEEVVQQRRELQPRFPRRRHALANATHRHCAGDIISANVRRAKS